MPKGERLPALRCSPCRTSFKKVRATQIVVTIASKVQHAAYFRQIRLLEEQIGQRNRFAKSTTSALTRLN
jgi:hypothetical protein